MGNCCRPSAATHTRDFPSVEAKKPIPFVSCNMSNHYVVNYPVHEKRTETSIYRKTRKEMSHLPCFICGRMKGDNNTSLETHHFYIEKAATNAIDWEKFGVFAKNTHHIQTGENIGEKMDWKKVESNPDLFVDSRHNMIVLCKQHHTSGNTGIHHVPFPDWISQKFAVDGFQFLS